MADAKIRIKASLGALVTAYQSAQEALKEDDMPKMCRWLSVALQGEQALLQSLKMLEEQTQDRDIRKFLGGAN